MEKIEKEACETKEDFKAFDEERGLSRRSFIKSASVVTAAVMLPPLFKPSVARAAAMSDSNIFAYVGCWQFGPSNWAAPPTSGKGFGIFKYNPKTADLELVQSNVMDKISVGQACLDARRNIFYVTDERMVHPPSGDDKGSGSVIYALAINPKTGALTELSRRPSLGSLPSYAAVDATGKYLIVTHHTSNTPLTKTIQDASGKYRCVWEYDEAPTVLFRLNDDGTIGDACDIYRHTGSGPDPEQTHPRVHSVMMSPSGKLFAVCDKGSDKFFFFRINRTTEKLEVCGEPYKSFTGSAPRYSAFHPTLPYWYMNHEIKPVVSAFRYDEDGKVTFIHAADVLPEGTKSDRSTMSSDIRVHPSGKYLYNLVRGLELLSVFAINEKTGGIERIQTVKLEVKGPRGCAISPDGRFILIAMLNDSKVLVWAIGEDGKVSPTGKSVSQPNPGTVNFFPA